MGLKRNLLPVLSLGLAVSCTGAIGESGEAESGFQNPGGSSGESAGGSGSPGLPGRELAATIGVRRLGLTQYNNTVRDLLGDHTAPASGWPDPRKPQSPFGSYVDQESQVSAPLIGSLETLATRVAAAFMKDVSRRDRIIGCVPTGPKCSLRDFVTRFGRRALRRPLTNDDIQVYLQIPEDNGTGADFYASVEDIVRAFLQDLEFLHRIEIGSPVPGIDGLFKLNGFELATRLSYFLWNSMPPDWLLDRVEKENGLSTPDDLRAVATMMLADPRAREQVVSFHALWLGYAGLATDAYPLSLDMWNETKALVSKVVFDDKEPWQDLLRSTGTIVSYELADHYKLRIPPGFKPGAKPMWVSYEGTKRQGLLSQTSILRYGSKFGDTSPVLRGKLIRERLFCQTIPPPDPKLKVNVDEAPKAVDSSLCKWNRYQPLITQAACAGCHTQMNPIGFGLENYDAVGRYRSEQWWQKDANGAPVLVAPGTAGAERCRIRSDGDLDGQPFNSPGQLADLMINSGGLTSCVLKNLYQLTTGRGALDGADGQAIGMLEARTAGKDFDFEERLLDVVMSGMFSHRRMDN